MVKMKNFVYEKPINVYYEITIACDLNCKHCRAEAIPERSKEELKLEEIKEVLRDIKGMGSNLIISGGDPLKREDIFEILDYAKEINLPVAVTPTTSPLATFEKIKKMKEKGIFSIAVSIDGDRESHDNFRGVNGTFENSINVLNYAKELNIPVQVNTIFTKGRVLDVKKVYDILYKNFSPPVKRWSIFFLVPTGRGSNLFLPSYNEILEIFEFLYEKSKSSPFYIGTTEAPFYRVFYLLKENKNFDDISNLKMGFGVRDGNGVIFVSHKGDIYPSGFLPLKIGNVKKEKLSEVYKNNEIMKKLRDVKFLKGKCGKCIYKNICGGARARAYALKGDYLEEDPICIF
jgi:radical SAM protein with 4Fe4S-binding SPASM domain